MPNSLKQFVINQSINQSTNQSINQSINRPINQSIDQSINQSIDQSINQSINQLIDQSTNQSINQSTEHGTSCAGFCSQMIWKNEKNPSNIKITVRNLKIASLLKSSIGLLDLQKKELNAFFGHHLNNRRKKRRASIVKLPSTTNIEGLERSIYVRSANILAIRSDIFREFFAFYLGLRDGGRGNDGVFFRRLALLALLRRQLGLVILHFIPQFDDHMFRLLPPDLLFIQRPFQLGGAIFLLIPLCFQFGDFIVQFRHLSNEKSCDY